MYPRAESLRRAWSQKEGGVNWFLVTMGYQNPNNGLGFLQNPKPSDKYGLWNLVLEISPHRFCPLPHAFMLRITLGTMVSGGHYKLLPLMTELTSHLKSQWSSRGRAKSKGLAILGLREQTVEESRQNLVVSCGCLVCCHLECSDETIGRWSSVGRDLQWIT